MILHIIKNLFLDLLLYHISTAEVNFDPATRENFDAFDHLSYDCIVIDIV